MEGIFTYGTRVLIVETQIKAWVKGVSVQGPNNSMVEYDICYWINGTRYTVWVRDFEIELAPKPRKAGFVDYNKPQLNA